MALIINNLNVTDNIQGDAFSSRKPVRVATTAAGALGTSFENGDTVDGVLLSAGDRILIKDQASATENGIYIVNTSGAPTRATDMDTGSNAASIWVVVQEGTLLADSTWLCVNDEGSDIVGTNNIVFSQSSGNGADGDVTGPASSTANGIPVFSDTGGKTLSDGGITITGGALVTNGNNLALSGASDTLNFNRTNILSLNAATISTTNRTVTLPDPGGLDTVTYLALAQTLTNKTLTSPAIGTSVLDTNGNELLTLTPTASAVNEINIANAVAGLNPTFTASGASTNIGLNLSAKGNGAVQIASNSAANTGKLRLLDNSGGQYAGISPPSAVTTSYTLTLPNGVGTSGQVLSTDGFNPATLSWITPSASVANTSAGSVAATSTTSLTYVLMNSMTITPPSGTYYISFSSSGSLDSANQTGNYAIFVAGTVSAATVRAISSRVNQTANMNSALHTQLITTVNGSQAIEIRYQITGGTFNVNARNLIALKL